MIKLMKKICMLGLTCSGILFIPPQAYASSYTYDTVTKETSSGYLVKVEGASADVYARADQQSDSIGVLGKGSIHDVVAYQNGWVQIETESGTGYLKISEQVILAETVVRTVDTSAELRKDVVGYALQFLGNTYQYGGSDPNRGVDCSGFTSYVMKHAAGVTIPHSSGGQSQYGTAVAIDQIKAGDLLFYSSGSRINHVAIYIGKGQVVHASTDRTGIKISPWNYRTPVKAVDLLSNR